MLISWRVLDGGSSFKDVFFQHVFFLSSEWRPRFEAPKFVKSSIQGGPKNQNIHGVMFSPIYV